MHFAKHAPRWAPLPQMLRFKHRAPVRVEDDQINRNLYTLPWTCSPGPRICSELSSTMENMSESIAWRILRSLLDSKQKRVCRTRHFVWSNKNRRAEPGWTTCRDMSIPLCSPRADRWRTLHWTWSLWWLKSESKTPFHAKRRAGSLWEHITWRLPYSEARIPFRRWSRSDEDLPFELNQFF